MLRRALPTLVLCLAADLALAQSIDCTNAEAQQEMNFCAEKEWQAADVELNQAYKAVLADMQALDKLMPPELQGAEDALRTAQRAWITYRDANCQLAGYPMRGGSAEPLLIYSCLRQMTENRSGELWALLNT